MNKVATLALAAAPLSRNNLNIPPQIRGCVNPQFGEDRVMLQTYEGFGENISHLTLGRNMAQANQPSISFCLTKWQLIVMCSVLSWKTGLHAI